MPRQTGPSVRSRSAADEPRWGLAFLLLGLVVLPSLGCFAPRKGRDVRGKTTSEEVARRMREAGATPVVGEVSSSSGDEPPPVGDPMPLADPSVPQVQAKLQEIQAAAEDEEPEEEIVQSPYLRFGERIILRSQGEETFITKPYSMPPGRGQKVLELMSALDPFPFRQKPEGNEVPPLEANTLEYQLLKNWDEE